MTEIRSQLSVRIPDSRPAPRMTENDMMIRKCVLGCDMERYLRFLICCYIQNRDIGMDSGGVGIWWQVGEWGLMYKKVVPATYTGYVIRHNDI